MELPSRTPDSVEVFEVIRELDRLAKAARIQVQAKAELAEGYTKQGDNVRDLRARMEMASHSGYAAGCEHAARKLAALFGIERPEPPDLPVDEE